MANNRKSIQEKKMSGTYRQDRDGGKEDVQWMRLNEIPEPPQYFSPYAKELWETYCTELLEREDLCRVYIGSLEQYCYAIDLAQRAAKELNSSLTTASKANPAVSPHFRVWQQAVKTINDIGQQFGFSPKSRANIPSAEKPEELSDLFR